MKYTLNFGRMAAKSTRARISGKAFRIAVLGDFSGRANQGTLETSATLASRKPLRVDVDNLEAIVERMGLELHLPIAAEGGTAEVRIESMDDFHPDQLYNKLEVFRKLADLRRRLKNTSTFPGAAAEVGSWGGAAPREGASFPRAKPRSTAIPHGKLDDFARLIGRNSIGRPPMPADELIKRIVGPHIVAAPNPQQESLLACVDEALAATMRRVLHHPDFQSLESLWRSIDLLTRELETDTQLQIVLYDITAEELAADLSSSDALEETGLYSLLVEQPSLDEQQGPLSVLLGNYIFEQTPPHAELLGRIGKIAAAAQAPFIAGISTECLKKKKPEEVHPLILESWGALRSMPHSCYLGLAVPRFMLRWPYGAKTEPIESFDFEEFSEHSGLNGMLWANGSILAGLLLGKTFSEQGMNGMKPGSIMSIDDVPFYYYTDADGDQVALPSTERLVSESTAAYVNSQGFMPVLAIRGRPEVRLGGFHSFGGPVLAGPWSPIAVAPDAPAIVTAPSGVDKQMPTVAAFEAEASAEADKELDALVASVDSSTTGSTAQVQSDNPSSQSGDDELDALLAGLASDESDQASDEAEMDPDLADLLASL
jgi:type VI secretion system protein ImpC